MEPLCGSNWKQSVGIRYPYQEKSGALQERVVFHVFEVRGVYFCCTELVRRDKVAEVFFFGCKPVPFFQLQRYAG